MGDETYTMDPDGKVRNVTHADGSLEVEMDSEGSVVDVKWVLREDKKVEAAMVAEYWGTVYDRLAETRGSDTALQITLKLVENLKYKII